MNERTYIVCFTEPIHLVCEVRGKTYVFLSVSIKHGLRTTDCGLGIKHGQGIRHGLRTTDYGLRTTDYGLKYGLRTTHFAHFGLESVMVFEGTTGAYMNGRIYRFNFK